MAALADIKDRLTNEPSRAERAAEALTDLRDRFGDEPSRTERLTGALEDARDRLTGRVDDLGDDLGQRTARLRGDLSERTDRFGDTLEDLTEDETFQEWAPRLTYALVGFVLGFLIGRAAANRKRRDDDIWADEPITTGSVETLGRAPRTHGVGVPS